MLMAHILRDLLKIKLKSAQLDLNFQIEKTFLNLEGFFLRIIALLTK